VAVLILGGRARRNRKVLRAVELGDGEVVEVVSVVGIGSLEVVSLGDVGSGIRPRCGLVLTDRRLILVRASPRTGRMLGVAADLPRQHLVRSEVRTRAYLSFDVFDSRFGFPMNLSFSLPNREEGRHVAAAFPVSPVGTW
jgi:hypothetical protein